MGRLMKSLIGRWTWSKLRGNCDKLAQAVQWEHRDWSILFVCTFHTSITKLCIPRIGRLLGMLSLGGKVTKSNNVTNERSQCNLDLKTCLSLLFLLSLPHLHHMALRDGPPHLIVKRQRLEPVQRLAKKKKGHVSNPVQRLATKNGAKRGIGEDASGDK